MKALTIIQPWATLIAKAEAQPQAQGINPAALLAAMFANAANQQPRDDTGNESDDDE